MYFGCVKKINNFEGHWQNEKNLSFCILNVKNPSWFRPKIPTEDWGREVFQDLSMVIFLRVKSSPEVKIAFLENEWSSSCEIFRFLVTIQVNIQMNLFCTNLISHIQPRKAVQYRRDSLMISQFRKCSIKAYNLWKSQCE